MSSPAANPQHEPTMEEILASIRKIISEDQPEAAAKPAAAPALRAVPNDPPPAPAPAPAPAAELDVLELTDEVKEEVAPVAAAAPAPIENDIAFESIDPAPAPEPDDEEDAGELISTSTRSAMGRAFASMDKGPVEYKAPGGGAIESIFVQAVQSAFQPTLQEWVDSHNAEILDTLKPLIRAWMDEHLPPLIEAAVAKEISRAAAKRKR